MTNLRSEFKKSFFEPSFLSLLTNPYFLARRALFKSLQELNLPKFDNVLDVGCGTKPYEQLIKCNRYTGIEFDSEYSRKNSKADIFYDGKHFPVDSEKYGLVISNQVLEHVFEPEIFIKEIRRVLQNNGTLILTVPFVWEEHEKPFDYGRYTSFGLKHLFEKNGFKIIESKKLCTGFMATAQIITSQIFKSFPARENLKVRLILTFIFIFPIHFLSLILEKMITTNQDLYLDNFIVATKKHD